MGFGAECLLTVGLRWVTPRSLYLCGFGRPGGTASKVVAEQGRRKWKSSAPQTSAIDDLAGGQGIARGPAFRVGRCAWSSIERDDTTLVTCCCNSCCFASSRWCWFCGCRARATALQIFSGWREGIVSTGFGTSVSGLELTGQIQISGEGSFW